MQLIRLCFRFPIFLLWTTLLVLLRFLIWPSALYSERLDRRLRRPLLQTYSKGFAAILGIRVIPVGTPPTPPFYIVANHLSYLDILVLNHTTGCVFVSRGDVRHWPVIGFLVNSMYILFIDRNRKSDTVRVNQLIEHTLEQGDGLAVFAESRIYRGQDVAEFKSSLIQPAVANHRPVHYATLHYETKPGAPPASKIVMWWRPEGFFTHFFRLMRHRGLTATITFGPAPIAGEDRKVLAQTLWQAVRENFIPIV